MTDGGVDRAGCADGPLTPAALEKSMPAGMAITDRGLGGVVLGHVLDGIEYTGLNTIAQAIEH